MKRQRIILSVVVIVLALAPLAMLRGGQDKPAAAARPLGLQDILLWKSLSGADLSVDGTWFIGRIAPVEGESEIVVRETRGQKIYRFPIGEAPRYGSPAEMGFSADARWAAFLTYPGSKEARTLRKDKKRVMTTAALVNLATGEKTDFEKVRAFAFSGENPGWIALQKYTAESQDKEKDKWTGADLILRELATGKEINIGNAAEFGFDKNGRRLAYLIDAQGQTGNGIQLRDMTSGAVTSLDDDKAAYKSLLWSERETPWLPSKARRIRATRTSFGVSSDIRGSSIPPGLTRWSSTRPGTRASPRALRSVRTGGPNGPKRSTAS